LIPNLPIKHQIKMGITNQMMPAPEAFPERILLAVTGLSPQIVTETLYALCVTRSPPFIPTRIHLLTTVEGASRAELTLLHPHQGKFMRFCEDYGLTGKIHFDLSCIEVIRNVDGEPLPDIRTPEENASAANTISACVQRITADPNTALHVSIAGGRKTMGFYLGYALSLFGRSQDRLSHVLVPEPFESNHNFYYPPPTPEVLFTNTNKPVSTSEANIMLAEIPFVRLRHGLPEELLASGVDFSQAVEAAQQNLAPPRVEISFNPARLVCGGREVFLSPQIFSFYAWLAKLRKDGNDSGAMEALLSESKPAFIKPKAVPTLPKSSSVEKNTKKTNVLITPMETGNKLTKKQQQEKEASKYLPEESTGIDFFKT